MSGSLHEHCELARRVLLVWPQVEEHLRGERDAQSREDPVPGLQLGRVHRREVDLAGPARRADLDLGHRRVCEVGADETPARALDPLRSLARGIDATAAAATGNARIIEAVDVRVEPGL